MWPPYLCSKGDLLIQVWLCSKNWNVTAYDGIGITFFVFLVFCGFFFYSSWLGTYTSINNWEVKLILWTLIVKCQCLHISGWSALCYWKLIMSGVTSTKLVTGDESKPLQKGVCRVKRTKKNLPKIPLHVLKKGKKRRIGIFTNGPKGER